MKEAGVKMVSVGTCAWALVEPRPGEFDFGWFDDVVDGLAAASVSAAPPPWLATLHPQTLPGRRQHAVARVGVNNTAPAARSTGNTRRAWSNGWPPATAATRRLRCGTSATSTGCTSPRATATLWVPKTYPGRWAGQAACWWRRWPARCGCQPPPAAVGPPLWPGHRGVPREDGCPSCSAAGDLGNPGRRWACLQGLVLVVPDRGDPVHRYRHHRLAYATYSAGISGSLLSYAAGRSKTAWFGDGRAVDGQRRLVGIDLGIASAHTVRVLDGFGREVCRRRCEPSVASLTGG